MKSFEIGEKVYVILESENLFFYGKIIGERVSGAYAVVPEEIYSRGYFSDLEPGYPAVGMSFCPSCLLRRIDRRHKRLLAKMLLAYNGP